MHVIVFCQTAWDKGQIRENGNFSTRETPTEKFLSGLLLWPGHYRKPHKMYMEISHEKQANKVSSMLWVGGWVLHRGFISNQLHVHYIQGLPHWSVLKDPLRMVILAWSYCGRTIITQSSPSVSEGRND